MDSSFFILGVIIIGMASSWYLGYRSQSKRSYSWNSPASKDYFIGLNYLLNEEPDDAIDVFIDSLELNTKTLETYMALGTLLRRRGKVDRSISVYQKLLAWPHISKSECDDIKIELVRSYVAAGLLDRAEGLLNELGSASQKIRKLALSQGIIIYRLEKDWVKVISLSNSLLKLSSSTEKYLILKETSHFYCELAELQITDGHFNDARDLIKKSFQKDKDSVRASLLLGKLEFQLANYKEAIKSLNIVKQQDQNFYAEAFPILLLSYQKAGLNNKIEKFIESSLSVSNSSKVLLAITDYIESENGKNKAFDFLIGKLHEIPSARMLDRALKLASEENNISKESLLLFHKILKAYLSSKALYKCDDCGFDLKKLHWMCPSCSSWGSVKPAQIISQE